MHKLEDAAAPASPHMLRVLLLICAGALVIIIVVLADMFEPAQFVQVETKAMHFCGMSEVEYRRLPLTLQHRINGQCVAEPKQNE